MLDIQPQFSQWVEVLVYHTIHKLRTDGVPPPTGDGYTRHVGVKIVQLFRNGDARVRIQNEAQKRCAWAVGAYYENRRGHKNAAIQRRTPAGVQSSRSRQVMPACPMISIEIYDTVKVTYRSILGRIGILCRKKSTAQQFVKAIYSMMPCQNSFANASSSQGITVTFSTKLEYVFSLPSLYASGIEEKGSQLSNRWIKTLDLITCSREQWDTDSSYTVHERIICSK